MGIRKNLRKLTERKRLGEILIEMKLLTEEQLNLALEKASKAKVLLGNFLLAEGYVSEEQMAQALASQFALRTVDLRQWDEIDPLAVKMIPEAVARKHQLVPLKVEKNTLVLAVHDPLSLVNLNSIPELAGSMVMPMVATPTQIRAALERIYASESDTKLIERIALNLQQRSETVVPLRPARAQATPESLGNEKLFSIESLLNKIIEKAIDNRASDVHFEPLREQVRVRQRIDGILHEAQNLPLDIYPSVISRIKILGQMDIAERRQPQDGHFQLRMGTRDVDFRVSTLPTVHGEKTVLRILDKGAQRASLAETGMAPPLQAAVKGLVRRPFGIVLVTGPTGSGKTTTVYSMIREIDRHKQNVVTIEDPVEFEIDDVNQVQVNQKANVLFANTLRSVLRQDPDVIMVGEIRDKETADIAIRSALTGHLVISTIHTNNSVGTLSRLVEMGVEPYLVSSSLAGVLSQRLVRKLCPHCRVPYAVTEEERELLGASLVPAGTTVYKAAGCAQCNHIGFRGRVGIFELLELDPELRRLVSLGQMDEPVASYMAKTGFRTLRHDGVEKLLAGLTTVDEVVSETI
jgi:type IV pilus assembly protein PilB